MPNSDKGSQNTDHSGAVDLHLVVGNVVIESPSYLRSRYFESMALYDIWYEYFEEGFKWISGPRPRISVFRHARSPESQLRAPDRYAEQARRRPAGQRSRGTPPSRPTWRTPWLRATTDTA